MKKTLFTITAFLLLAGLVQAATNVSWTKNQLIQYPNYVGDSVVIGNTATTTNSRLEVNGTSTSLVVVATSTTASSSLPRLTSTGVSTTWLCLNGTCNSSWPAGGGSGSVSTSSAETKGQIPYWTTSSGYPATLGSVTTSTPSVSAPITYSGTLGNLIGGTSGSFGCTNASSGVTGCLTGTDWNTFNGKESVLTFSFPLSRSVNTISSLFSTTTNTGMSAGNLYIGSGGIMSVAASSSIFGYTPLNPTRNLTVAGTANQISSSAGAQDLSADRTWTLSFPTAITFPGTVTGPSGTFGTSSIGTLNATSTINVLTLNATGVITATNATSTFSNLTINTFASTSQLSIARGFFQTSFGDCDTGASSKVLYNITDGKFSCGTDQTGGGTSRPSTYSYIVDADGLGDYTTIQGALDACAAAGGGSIYLSDHYYYLGGTGLKFKSNDCNVYGVYASTTIEVAGATTAFSTNSAASAYANNGVHNVVIVGDGNTGSIGIDMSDMIRSRYTGIVMDNLGRGFRLNDTQNVTFYNTVRDFAITTMQVAGIDASSTNPTNDNKFSDGFIGCAVSGCIGINLNNAQNNLFYSVSLEPATSVGTIGVKIDVDARATNSGTFANQFYGLYAEANKIGIAASSSISATKAIHSNGFFGGQIVANTTDTLDSSGGESISFFGVNINYTQVNQQATTTFKGGTYLAGLGDCDTAATSKVLYDVTTGRFSCGTDQSVAGGGLPGNLYADSGRFGVGSSTPWSALTVVGTSTMNPIFALATSTTAFPFFWAQNPNSSSTIPYNGASVSQVGINFALNGTTTLRDNTYIGGRTVNWDYVNECQLLSIPIAMTADNQFVCNGWGLDVDADQQFGAGANPIQVESLQAPLYYYSTLAATTPVTGDTGAFRTPNVFFATNTPVMAATVTYTSATSSNFLGRIGFIATPWGQDYGGNSVSGAYFEASSTVNNNWKAVVRLGSGVAPFFADTGVPTSTRGTVWQTGSTANQEFPQHMRVEMKQDGVDFFINGLLVARYSGSMSVFQTNTFNLSAAITNAVVTTMSPARSMRIYNARAWQKNLQPVYP